MTRISYAASLALSAAILASSALPAAAATFSVLYSFKHPCCGFPQGRLYFLNGHLFGTGHGMGSGDYGQVFELTKSGSSWTETSPYMFSGTDGAQPAAGLILDLGGYFFGTTSAGDAYGYGNAFVLYYSGGTWKEGTIWPFGGTSGDGREPLSDLVKDSSGNLYGTTYSGGSYGYGTVFELTYSAGKWSETILHSFGSGNDGQYPTAGLHIDSSGNLYGTTSYGGTGDLGSGTVFELTDTGGVWTETVIHNFNGSGGDVPQGTLIEGPLGALYGTTVWGGAYAMGNVFKLFQSGGVWKLKNLYSFTGGSDGGFPQAGLRFSATGALYGTTYDGGGSGCGGYGCGTVFELTNSGGVWSESVLHNFADTGGDGFFPEGQIALDKSGNLYGTAQQGGFDDYGTVWEVTP